MIYVVIAVLAVQSVLLFFTYRALLNVRDGLVGAMDSVVATEEEAEAMLAAELAEFTQIEPMSPIQARLKHRNRGN
jgi:hypothetical protein